MPAKTVYFLIIMCALAVECLAKNRGTRLTLIDGFMPPHFKAYDCKLKRMDVFRRKTRVVRQRLRYENGKRSLEMRYSNGYIKTPIEIIRDGKVPHGTFTEIAKDYGCHWLSIKRIWGRYGENVALGIADGAPESRIKGNSGWKPYDRSKLSAKLKEVPIFDRHRVAATAARIGFFAWPIRALLDAGHLARRS
ncbi:hypothetical protein L914_09857 [Phytophthora nicotianae]|uniref:Uncharacterized protein n=3 Tax=Phytophthora nicotianae TaxID=4792 RepID=W2N8F9_PHYNI|nr:hypothetical protein L914_09857 [Phytophthora nicotianae]